MPTTVSRVTVGRETPSARDVLEYATALIRAFGWNSKIGDGVESSESTGYTLHDAVGESCTRLSKAATGGSQGTKSWSVTTHEGVARDLRVEATDAIAEAVVDTGFDLSKSGSGADIQFNDQAKDEAEIIAILEAASGKVKE